MAYAVPYLMLIKCKFNKFRLKSKSKVNCANGKDIFLYILINF